MKHIRYHGIYKKREEVEMDAQEYLPKRAEIEFAHKQNISQEPSPGVKVYTETFMVMYVLDKRIYGLNGQRSIVNRNAEPWRVKLTANIDPARQLVVLPDYIAAATSDSQRSQLYVMQQLYERLAALERFWAGQITEDLVPIVMDRLKGMGVEGPRVN
jgi:hypothetical protein